MVPEQFELLIIETLNEVKKFTNYNKPDNAVYTCCDNTDIFSELKESPHVLLQISDSTWSVKNMSELKSQELGYIKKIFYSADQKGRPSSEEDLSNILRSLSLYHELHIPCIKKICDDSEKALCKFILKTDPKYCVNICLLQTFAKSRFIHLLKKGNCGDICDVFADLLIRKYATRTHKLLPIAIIMSSFNELSHVFMVINCDWRQNPTNLTSFGGNAWIIDPYNQCHIKASNLQQDNTTSFHLLRACLAVPFSQTLCLNTHGILCGEMDVQLEKFFDPKIKEIIGTISNTSEFKELHCQIVQN